MGLATTEDFHRFAPLTFAIEGRDRLSLDPADPGNWTGGEPGKGTLRGTRWGFSAASFPEVDIEHLTEDLATGLAFAHVWLPAKCTLMPPALALLMYDAAFQHGVRGATEILQRALGVGADGDFGAATQSALAGVVKAEAPTFSAVRIAFQAQRMVHMAAQRSWQEYPVAFAERLCRVLCASAQQLELEGL